MLPSDLEHGINWDTHRTIILLNSLSSKVANWSSSQTMNSPCSLSLNNSMTNNFAQKTIQGQIKRHEYFTFKSRLLLNNVLSILLYLYFPHTWIPVEKHGLKQYFMGQYPVKFKFKSKNLILDLQWVIITPCSKELCIYRQEN